MRKNICKNKQQIQYPEPESQFGKLLGGEDQPPIKVKVKENPPDSSCIIQLDGNMSISESECSNSAILDNIEIASILGAA